MDITHILENMLRNKLAFTILSFILLDFLAFPQDTEIRLPEVTTYVKASAEEKIVVTEEEIQEAHLESLSDVVERSGIQNLAYGPYGLESKPSIRGFTDETVRVVIDGICVNNAQYGTFDFSTINLDGVERIEIVRGGFTEGVEDEGSVGGVIYITMKKTGIENKLTADSSLKTFFNKDRPLDSYFQKLNFSGLLGTSTFLNAGVTANFADNQYFFKTASMGDLPSGPFAALGQGQWQTRKNAQVIDGQANAYLTHYFGNGNYFSFGDLAYAGYKHTPGKAFSTNP
nr:TonB-dependent receptor plug domain-containing protein [Treponema sp.]